MPMLHSSVTNRAKDQGGARSLDKSFSPSLGIGVADEFTIRIRIYLLCLWTWINQNGHLRARVAEEAGSNEKGEAHGGCATWPIGSVAVPCPMTSISRLATHSLVWRKGGFMRGPHRHQHDAAARLLIRLNTLHPWNLRFGRRLAPTAACWSVKDIQATFPRRLGSKRGTFAYLNHGASAFLAIPVPITAATTMSMNCFPTQNFQFMNHSGPPKPKLTLRREHTKTMLSEEYNSFELDESLSTRPAFTSRRAKDFDLASGGYSQSMCLFSRSLITN
jgi:hypothetical protein